MISIKLAFIAGNERKRNSRSLMSLGLLVSSLLLLLLLLEQPAAISAFSSIALSSKPKPSICPQFMVSVGAPVPGSTNDNDNITGGDDTNIDFLFEELADEQTNKAKPASPVDADIERAWRSVKKPLLSVGAKGAKPTQGNSLKSLLRDHFLVKVKVNTKPFGTIENAFKVLRDYAVEYGASKDIELIQARDGEKIMLIGLPGMLKKIKSGDYPPPQLVPSESE